jgi:tetratricopeptide (TPR) repeat protein
MANNTKLREQARTAEQKENWAAAIGFYRQILDNPDGAEDTDTSLWNRLGDLHLKVNETERAVEAYEAAVKGYAEAGLHNNAIALCRKVLRLVPGRASIYLKLGQISAAKGFLADARQNFLEYAERMQRAGKLDASFEALKEFADLSPTDTDVRRLLAEQLASHGRKDEAVEQLRILIHQAEEKGATAVADELRQRIRDIDPAADTSALRREAAGRGTDDFSSAFDTGAFSIDAPAAAPPPPAAPAAPAAPLADGPGLDLEIAPLAGLEPTSLDMAPPRAAPPPPPPPPPAAPAIGGDLSLDEIRIEPLAPSAPDGPAPTWPDEDVEAAEDDGAGGDLPLMDFGDEYGAVDLPEVAPLEGLETRHDSFDTLDDEDAGGGDLPLMDFGLDEPAAAEPLPLLDAAPSPPAATPPAAVPTPPAAPAPDRLETLRARVAAEPGDVEALRALVAELEARGLAYEAETTLDEAHRALGALARYGDALDAVGELLGFRPNDAALLQKQVEYAFRSGDRARLAPAYIALGEHLMAAGDENKGRAVFQRVLEIDPQNERALAAVQPPKHAAPETPAAPAAPADDYIDLGALIMDDEPQGFTTRFVVEEKEPTGDEDRDFAEMLQHFRQKVSENIEVEDSSSHYDLGVAFKEMGLIDEAIAEFQVALRGGANPLATLELLGQCFVEKGQYAVASRVLDRALRITGAADAELIGVLYQLGRSEEAMGNAGPARDYYERVLAIDIRFRDTSRRLDSLRAKA